MGFAVLFDNILKFHCTISVNFYLYLQSFYLKFFDFSKISEIEMDSKFAIFLSQKKKFVSGEKMNVNKLSQFFFFFADSIEKTYAFFLVISKMSSFLLQLFYI